LGDARKHLEGEFTGAAVCGVGWFGHYAATGSSQVM
jgi:hypothetical protein